MTYQSHKDFTFTPTLQIIFLVQGRGMCLKSLRLTSSLGCAWSVSQDFDDLDSYNYIR